MLRFFHNFGFSATADKLLSDFGFKAWACKTAIRNPQSAIDPQHPSPERSGFTLIEMLVAMAITLIMMAAVVTLFANVSNSVRNRRATMELNAQIRQVRNTLQEDLQGATCPGLTWQRPESNHGYIELIEGPCREGEASLLVDGNPNFPKSSQPAPNWPPSPLNPEIDHKTSILPSSDPATTPFADSTWATDGAGLGDADDIVALTVRNEHKPFVGRGPTIADKQAYPDWGYESVESPLAEVVWFAIENPGYTTSDLSDDPTANHFFGEPGMRTIYRRTLLIAPWLNPYKPLDVDGNGLVQDTGSGTTFKPVPGLLRMLPPSNFKQTDVDRALAALISFQDRYDISCRLEWDYGVGAWKILANTLGDLTKRENRFGHYGFWLAGTLPGVVNNERRFPFALESIGSGYSGTPNVQFVPDPDVQNAPNPGPAATATANLYPTTGSALSYSVAPASYASGKSIYKVRPFAYVSQKPNGGVPATAQAMMNDDGQVIRVVHGPVPLWGTRRGEDVMLSDVLAFDLRVFDPGAPLFATWKNPSDTTQGYDIVLTPSDPGWRGQAPTGANGAYFSTDNMGAPTPAIGTTTKFYPYVGQGAYVDMGYGFDPSFAINTPPGGDGFFPLPVYSSSYQSSGEPWFFTPRAITDVYGTQLAPGFSVYDTWSFHYENNGIIENQFALNTSGTWVNANSVVDAGTNGLEDTGNYYNPVTKKIEQDRRNGVDDAGERETVPPYDKPLRGVQIIIRAYERDSRAIRQVRVSQHFMPE